MTRVRESDLRIGTSGWNYPSGKGTWNGLFYPATRSVRNGTKAFDELRFYAEHFLPRAPAFLPAIEGCATVVDFDPELL